MPLPGLIRLPRGSPGPLALDGHATGPATTGTTLTATLTTIQPNDVIVACIFNTTSPNARTVSSVAGAGTTGWTLRGGITFNNVARLELWYGIAAAPLSAVLITATMSGAISNSGIAVFGVSGADTSVIHDANASLPKTASGSGGAAPTATAISTTNANDMLVACTGEQSGQTETAGAGFTLIDAFQTAGNVGTADQYRVVSALQASVSVAFGANATGNWGIIVDAIKGLI